MQKLSAQVGENAANAKHDAALVQALLVLSKRPAALDPARSAYLASIDGAFGPKSQKALRDFQLDQVFVGADGRSSAPVPGSTAGRVSAGDPTWRKLVAAAPRDMQDLRVLEGRRIVYVAASVDAASTAAVAQSPRSNFDCSCVRKAVLREAKGPLRDLPIVAVSPCDQAAPAQRDATQAPGHQDRRRALRPWRGALMQTIAEANRERTDPLSPFR
jgi:hypothetical protein